MIQCEACGMPMRKLSEFGGLKINNKYCVYCTDDKGKLKPFELKRDEMINYFIQENKIARKEAEKLVDQQMKKFNIWSKYYDH